jgi:hypothetical protein
MSEEENTTKETTALDFGLECGYVDRNEPENLGMARALRLCEVVVKNQYDSLDPQIAVNSVKKAMQVFHEVSCNVISTMRCAIGVGLVYGGDEFKEGPYQRLLEAIEIMRPPEVNKKYEEDTEEDEEEDEKSDEEEMKAEEEENENMELERSKKRARAAK